MKRLNFLKNISDVTYMKERFVRYAPFLGVVLAFLILIALLTASWPT